MTQIIFDASDFDRVAEIFDRLPSEMQRKAFGRAAARSKKSVEGSYARFASATLKIAQKLVRARMRSYLTSGDITLVVRSQQIPLHEMNPQQLGYGVAVKGRGGYEHAFIAKASSKRAAGLVLQRKGKGRLPVEMMFGPNPAGAIDRKPREYENLLAEIAAGVFAETILQQAEHLIGGGK